MSAFVLEHMFLRDTNLETQRHILTHTLERHILQQGATVAASTHIYFSLTLFGFGSLVFMHVGSNRHMLARFLYHGATHDGDGRGDVLPSK